MKSIAVLNLAESLPFDVIQVPPVRLERERLYYRPQGPLKAATGRRERLVFDFANLADASDRVILEFAKTWGVLGLCRHKKALFHQGALCLPRRAGDEFFEPISNWRRRARRIRTILSLKAGLKSDDLGTPSDWKTVWPAKPPADREAAGNVLAFVTSVLLSQVCVQPALLHVDGRLAIEFLGGNFYELIKAITANHDIESWLSTSGILLAEIAVGTALALEEGSGWTYCSAPECRRLYRPGRRTPEDRLHFCPECGKRAAWRMSKRRAAKRRRKETKRNPQLV